jgi:hypothetical protein
MSDAELPIGRPSQTALADLDNDGRLEYNVEPVEATVSSQVSTSSTNIYTKT